ncbi:tumor necrosis factor receptor superfamily member 14-like isoform X5 [Paramormyrops kingsleyae]|uniref:tumor necrosis factor receptor superfamily member 14-like isoform X5 n=1 Tax=Paramormyrops kingsleyae TaxID=1676925 RepID=UPI003B96A830
MTKFIFKQVYSPHLLLLCLTLCHACNLTEYKVGEECCPMCPSGHHVQKHCSRNANTTCAPCTGLTFNDEPNGLSHCKLCAVCDQGLGLKTVRACTPTSDTVCGILEGHYCISPYKGGCRTAHKHTACEPGQFIKQPGTTSAETECEDCQENTYSNGTSTSCMPHTDCESEGRVTVRAGDPASDAECGETSLPHHVLWPPVAAVVFIGIIIIVVCKRRKKRVQSYKVERTQE